MGPSDQPVGVRGGETRESRGGLWLQQLKGQEVGTWGGVGLPCRILPLQGSHHFDGHLHPSEVMPARLSLQTEFQTLRARRNSVFQGVQRRTSIVCLPYPTVFGRSDLNPPCCR